MDLNEVLLSFGFDDLIITEQSVKSDKIEKMIRRNKIIAPLFQECGVTIAEHHLDSYEKETLISIIDSIFALGVCKEETIFYNITEIIRKIDIYRRSRQEKTNAFFEKEENVFWDDIPGTDFKIAINERLKKQIDTYGLDISDVYIFL